MIMLVAQKGKEGGFWGQKMWVWNSELPMAVAWTGEIEPHPVQLIYKVKASILLRCCENWEDLGGARVTRSVADY